MNWKPEHAKNEYVHSKFVHECEHRIPVNATPICGLIGEMTDVPVQIFPRSCAKCRLNGEINHEFLRGESYNLLLGKFRDAILGLHNGAEHILDMLDRLLGLCKTGDSQLSERRHADLLDATTFVLTLARAPFEQVEPLFIKHGFTDVAHPTRQALKHAAALSVNAPPQPVPLDKPCSGCGGNMNGSSIFATVKAAIEGTAKAVAAIAGDKAATDEFERRKAICEGCQEKDSEGERMYRIVSPLRPLPKLPQCGAPFFHMPDRDQTKDGCGCLLEAKWSAAKEHCPLLKW